MQGWVDLCYVKADWPGIEPATCKSQVQRPTAKPPRNTSIIHQVQARYSVLPYSEGPLGLGTNNSQGLVGLGFLVTGRTVEIADWKE